MQESLTSVYLNAVGVELAAGCAWHRDVSIDRLLSSILAGVPVRPRRYSERVAASSRPSSEPSTPVRSSGSRRGTLVDSLPPRLIDDPPLPVEDTSSSLARFTLGKYATFTSASRTRNIAVVLSFYFRLSIHALLHTQCEYSVGQSQALILRSWSSGHYAIH